MDSRSRRVPGSQQDNLLDYFSNSNPLARPSYTLPPYPLSPNEIVSNKKEGRHFGGEASTKWLSVPSNFGDALMLRMQFIGNPNEHYILTPQVLETSHIKQSIHGKAI